MEELQESDDTPPAAGVSPPAGATAGGDSASEFDIFSRDELSRQFILVYHRRSGWPASAYANVTRSLVLVHRPYLRPLMSFSTLPGCVVALDLSTIDQSQRETFVDHLLATLRSHPALAFLTHNQPLSLGRTAGQSVHAGAYVPTGVRRILAGTRSTTARAADVAVAVLDTGIDLTSTNLNARSGINCIQRVAQAAAAAGLQQATRDFRFSPTDGDMAADASPPPPVATDHDDPGGEDTSESDDAYVDPTDADDDAGSPAQDDNNHGTHVAGIIGARNLPDAGVIGVAPDTRLYAVKILDAKGRGSFAHLVCGLHWLAINAERLNIKVNWSAHTCLSVCVLGKRRIS